MFTEYTYPGDVGSIHILAQSEHQREPSYAGERDASRTQAAHAPGVARRGTRAARGAELLKPQPAPGHARGRHRPNGLLPTLRRHGGARARPDRRIVPDAADNDPGGTGGPKDQRSRDSQLG